MNRLGQRLIEHRLYGFAECFRAPARGIFPLCDLDRVASPRLRSDVALVGRSQGMLLSSVEKFRSQHALAYTITGRDKVPACLKDPRKSECSQWLGNLRVRFCPRRRNEGFCFCLFLCPPRMYIRGGLLAPKMGEADQELRFLRLRSCWLRRCS